MKKLTKRKAYVFLAVVILFLAALLKWESISYFVLKNVIEIYADREHIALDVVEIKGELFSATTINNLTVRPAAGQPQAYHIKAGSISCTYNLWDLKEGFELFISGLDCSIKDSVFSYDFSVGDSVEEAAEEAAEEAIEFLVPAILPRLELKNGAVFLSHPQWSVEIKDMNGMLRSPEDRGHALKLEAGNVRFSQEGTMKVDTGFQTFLRYKDGRLSIDSFEVGDKEISAKGFIELDQIAEGNTLFESDLTFGKSVVNLSGSTEKWLLQSQIWTDNFDTGDLQERLGGNGWNMVGKIKGRCDLVYNLESGEDLKGSFSLGVQEGQVHGVGVDTLTVSGSFDREIFRVSLAEASTPGNHIAVSNVSVPMTLLQDGDVLPIIGGGQAQFSVAMSDVPSILKLLKVDEDVIPDAVKPRSLTIQGHLEKSALHLDGATAKAVDTILTIQESTIPIPHTVEAFDSVPINMAARVEISNIEKLAEGLGDVPVRGQIDVDVRIQGSIKEPVGNVHLMGEDLSFSDMPMGSLNMQGEVKARQAALGEIKYLEFVVIDLTQTNRSGTLSLLTPAKVTLQDDTYTMSVVFQLDGESEISIGIDKPAGKQLSAKITLRNLDSRGWLNGFIDNRFFFNDADIEAVMKGMPENPELNLTGNIGQIGRDGLPFPFTGSFKLGYSPKGIEIEEFAWTSHDRNQMNFAGHVPYDPLSPDPFLDSDLSVKGRVDFPALQDVAFLLEEYGIGNGAVSLDLDLSGPWEQPVGHVMLQAREVELLGTLKDYMGPTVSYSSDIVAKGDSITLKAANLEAASYSAQAVGSWKHGQSVKELLQKGTVELEGEVSADATVEMKDLNFLRSSLSGIRRVEGEIKGEIHVAGPVTGPSLQGSFSLRDGEVSHTFNFPMLSAVNLQGTFDEHSLHIDELQAELGGSPVSLKGMITREGEKSDINLKLEGSNVLLFRNSDMRVRGDVHLEVTGPLERLAITGTTGLTGGYYTKNFDFLGMIGSSSAPVSEGTGFLFSFPDPPLRDAVFDIKITSIEPFRIKNNLIRSALRPNLSLKGTGEVPFLVGRVYIDPSRVLLPSGRLQIQSGVLHFREGDPERPELDLVAQSKVLGYDINVITRGPLEEPVVTLSSSPSLPNDDLMLLLLTGQPPKDREDAEARSSGATNVIVYLGRDFLAKWLDNDPGASDETILDRFELDIGRGFTKSGEQTVESTFRLSEELSGTGRVYYLTGEKDKYDAYNYGMKVVFRLE
jgi:hypothetical protein